MSITCDSYCCRDRQNTVKVQMLRRGMLDEMPLLSCVKRERLDRRGEDWSPGHRCFPSREYTSCQLRSHKDDAYNFSSIFSSDGTLCSMHYCAVVLGHLGKCSLL